MSDVADRYYDGSQGPVFLQNQHGSWEFPTERELERFIMACPHPETIRARGYQVCTRCWAIPWRVPA